MRRPLLQLYSRHFAKVWLSFSPGSQILDSKLRERGKTPVTTN